MQKLNLEKPLVVFDLETTGVIINIDKVLELAYLKIYPDGREEKKIYRFNPGIKIPKESVAIHNITNEDIKYEPYFKEFAKEIFDAFSGCYFSGFNIIGFDLDMMKKEFLEVGISFQYKIEDIIDAKVIFHTMEKRDLSSAYKFYCGKEHTGAHGAEADVEVALEVLSAQLERYPEALDREFLRSIHSPKDERYVDADKRFYWRDGEAYFNFGKHKGESLKDVSGYDQGFLGWILQADFSPEIKEIVYNAQNGIYPQKD